MRRHAGAMTDARAVSATCGSKSSGADFFASGKTIRQSTPVDISILHLRFFNLPQKAHPRAALWLASYGALLSLALCIHW